MTIEEQENQNINLELTDKIAEGKFSNMVLINHSPTEFIVDFIQIMPGIPKAKVRSRIILTPEHTKKFLMALMENIQNYEQHFGEIQTKDNHQATPLNFVTPQGDA